MALIRCGGCGAVHEAAAAACPACGRCPACGAERIPRDELPAECDQCRVPFCSGCGRCPGCGKPRPLELEPCSCGHPADPQRVAKVERSFGVAAEPAQASGCWAVALLVLAVGVLVLIYWFS